MVFFVISCRVNEMSNKLYQCIKLLLRKKGKKKTWLFFYETKINNFLLMPLSELPLQANIGAKAIDGKEKKQHINQIVFALP